MQKPTKLILLCYALVYIIWSTTYLAVKLSVHSIPVFLFLGIRWLFSGLFIGVIGLVVYKKGFFTGVTRKQVINSVIIGFFLLVINQVLFAESMKTMDSYLAAVLSATIPLIMALFDYLMNGINFGKKTAFAIFLGIAGIGVLMFDGSRINIDFHVITLLSGIIVFSFGSALSHKIELPDNPIMNSTLQMLFAGLFSLGAFLVQGTGYEMDLGGMSIASILALAYLIIFGAIGMVAFIYLVKHEPLSRVSSYAFVNPIGATILGLVFGEMLKKNFIIAFPMILTAVLLMLGARKKGVHMEVEGDSK